MSGMNGITVQALPLDDVRRLLKQYGKGAIR